MLDHTFVFSCFYFLFLKRKSSKTYHTNIFLPLSPGLFLLEHLSCLSHCKTCWTMSLDNVGLKICLLGTSHSTVTLTFFPWSKPKRSWDEFNNQSQILQDPWDDFMVHRVNIPLVWVTIWSYELLKLKIKIKN